MENLNNFIKNNSMRKSEEEKLDNMVLGYTRSSKTSRFNLLPIKLIVFTMTILTLGFGMFFLPEKSQEKIVKPVSALEILTTTHNKLKEIISTPGIIHISYLSTYEHESIIGYDTFEVSKYIDNQNQRYLLEYLKKRSAGGEYRYVQENGLSATREFLPESMVVLYDGHEEYYISSSYTEKTGVTREMAKNSYVNELSGLADFYEFLLSKEASRFDMKETALDGEDVYVITFDYEGLAMGVSGKTPGEHSLTKNIYEGEVTIAKDTGLPVKHVSKVKDGSFEDTQTDVFGDISVLDEEEHRIINFQVPTENYRENELSARVVKVGNDLQMTGTVSYQNPGEDLIYPQVEVGGKKYPLRSSLLYDAIAAKSTIMGKFVAGKEIHFVGSIIEYGGTGTQVVWVKGIDFKQFTENSIPKSTLPVTPTPKQPVTLDEQLTLSLNHKLSENERRLQMMVPSETTLIRDATNGGEIEGEGFELIISSDYEDEGRLGSGYKDNYTLVETENFGEVYRVQSFSDYNVEDYEGFDPKFSQTFKYVDGRMFKTTGVCEGGFYSEMFGDPEAPCGNGALIVYEGSDIDNVSAILTIYCRANDREMMKVCDAIVASMKIVE